MEDKSHDKYAVKVDGSGRLTDRNRRYLRAFKPDTQATLPAPSTLSPSPITPHGHGQPGRGGVDVARQPTGAVQQFHEPVAVHQDGEGYTALQTRAVQQFSDPVAVHQDGEGYTVPSTPQQAEPGVVRRSGRVCQPNVKYPTAVFDMSSVTIFFFK